MLSLSQQQPPPRRNSSSRQQYGVMMMLQFVLQLLLLVGSFPIIVQAGAHPPGVMVRGGPAVGVGVEKRQRRQSSSSSSSSAYRFLKEDKVPDTPEPTIPPSRATLSPSGIPSTTFPSITPTQEPTVSMAPSPSAPAPAVPTTTTTAPPTTSTTTMYDLLPFRLTLQGTLEPEEQEPLFRTELEFYLLSQMSMVLNLDSTVLQIHLNLVDETENENNSSRQLEEEQERSLQQTATRLDYIGIATIIETSSSSPTTTTTNDVTTNTLVVDVSVQDQIHLAQILALENPNVLQEFINESTSTTNNNNNNPLILQRISVDDRDPIWTDFSDNTNNNDGGDNINNGGDGLSSDPSNGNTRDKKNPKNGPLIGVLVAVVVLVITISILLLRQMQQDKPPPPPPLELEIIPDVDDDDEEYELDHGDDEEVGNNGTSSPPLYYSTKKDNMEMVLKEPSLPSPSLKENHLATTTTTTNNNTKPRFFSARNLLSSSFTSRGVATPVEKEEEQQQKQNQDGDDNNNNNKNHNDDTAAQQEEGEEENNNNYYSSTTMEDDNGGSPNSVVTHTMSQNGDIISSAKSKKSNKKQGGFFSYMKQSKQQQQPSLYSDPVMDMSPPPSSSTSSKNNDDQAPLPLPPGTAQFVVERSHAPDNMDGSMEVTNISYTGSDGGKAITDLSANSLTQPHQRRMFGVGGSTPISSSKVKAAGTPAAAQQQEQQQQLVSLPKHLMPSTMTTTTTTTTTNNNNDDDASDEESSKIFSIPSIQSMMSNDDESMAGYSLATDMTGGNFISETSSPPPAPTNPSPGGDGGSSGPRESPVPAGDAMRKWLSAPREFLTEKKSDDPYTTSDSEMSSHNPSRRTTTASSTISQLGYSAAMNHHPNNNNYILRTSSSTGGALDESIEVDGRPDLFLDDDDDDDDHDHDHHDDHEDDDELYNSSWKEEDNIPGDSSILSGLLSQASDLEGVYTTTGSTLGEETTILDLPLRLHHNGGGGSGIGVSPYRTGTSPPSTTFQRFDPEEEFVSDQMIIPEPPAVLHYINGGSKQQHPSSSFDNFNPTSRVLRKVSGTHDKDDQEVENQLAVYQRDTAQDDFSDVPSDELNAMMNSMEQDLEGFGTAKEPIPTTTSYSATQRAMNRSVGGSTTSPSPTYRQQPYSNYSLPQQQQHGNYRQPSPSQQQQYNAHGWSTPERKPTAVTPPHAYSSGTATPTGSGLTQMVLASPASISPDGSWDLDETLNSGDAEYDATISQYLKERRRIKRATRKHRAARKQPPVTMEV